MRNYHAAFSTFLTLILFLSVARITPGADQSKGIIKPRDQGLKIEAAPPWKELYFQGGKGFTRVAATLRLRPARDFCPQGIQDVISAFIPCPLKKADMQVLSAETVVSNLIPPQEEYTQHVWFRQSDADAVQKLRLKKGTHPWIKAYRWEKNGVSRLKIQPRTPSQVNLECSKWTKKHKSFYTYSRGRETCRIISEPTLLFYILSAMDLRKNKFPLEVCVFGKKELHFLTIRKMKLKPISISFESFGLQGEKRIEKTIRPLVFYISESSGPNQNRRKEPFSLLGLHEEIYVFVDPATRLPVRIIGKTKRLGDMVLALTGAWLSR